jgi:hypothetical protein
VVITRRRALAMAGAGLLVGGCGAPEEPPADASLLRDSLAVEQDLVDAYSRMGGALGDALSAQAHRHVERLAPLVEGAAKTPARLSAQPVGGDPRSRALDAARRAMRVHVRGVGLLRDAAHRALVADVLTGDAQQVAVMVARGGGDPLASAFPDGREA